LSSELLSDARGAALPDEVDELARTLAQMWQAITSSDAARVRTQADGGRPQVSGVVNLLLGVVTCIGGFVEVGSISTAAQAGAEFGFQLLWAVALAGAILPILVEMSGRLAIVSRRTVAGAIRERFGIHFQ